VLSAGRSFFFESLPEVAHETWLERRTSRQPPSGLARTTQAVQSVREPWVRALSPLP